MQNEMHKLVLCTCSEVCGKFPLELESIWTQGHELLISSHYSLLLHFACSHPFRQSHPFEDYADLKAFKTCQKYLKLVRHDLPCSLDGIPGDP